MNSANHDESDVLAISLTGTPWIENPWYVLSALALCGALLIWANFNRPFYKFDDAVHLYDATEVPIGELFNIKSDQTLLPVSFLALRLDRQMLPANFY